MTPTAEYILRFAVADDDAAFVLVQAVQTGINALDMRLVATEGAAPYVGEIKHSKISALKSKKAAVSDAEWEAILVAVFGQKPAKDIQVLAQISPDESISLAVRRSVQGYSTRLGTILLTHSPDEELELMEWCSTASLGTAAMKEELYTSGIRITELEKTIEALKAQLAELVETRAQDENLMMEKFRNLLNEKKLKIRQQQVVIAEAGSAAAAAAKEAQSAGAQESEPEPEVPKATRGGRGRGRARGRAGRAVQPSRPSKRKAATQETQHQSDSESGFERMDVDIKQEEEDDEASEHDTGAESDVTRSTADEATASDSDSDHIPVRQSGRLARTKAAVATDDGDDDEGKTASEDDEEADEPPPPRALPFTIKKTAESAQALAGPSNVGDVTSDDDDDEL